VTHNSLSPYEESISQSDVSASDMDDLLVAVQVATLQDSDLSAQGEAIAAANVKISTEKRPARERRILASVVIPAPVEKVWQVITDYERLADFVPNLTSSKLLPHPAGKIRLEQIGAQCFLRFKFCARVVLEMSEQFPHKVGFAMTEGDFNQFEGAWQLSATAEGTHLSYDLSVKPPRAMPAALIEHHLRHNIAINLLAVRQRALELAS
jgi:ribosome-associated toxin RatA of RatAB toxin-antitoxin module